MGWQSTPKVIYSMGLCFFSEEVLTPTNILGGLGGCQSLAELSYRSHSVAMGESDQLIELRLYVPYPKVFLHNLFQAFFEEKPNPN